MFSCDASINFDNERNMLMRYLIRFSYDGTNFFGYQKQPNKRTVQNEIENVLSHISNSVVSISASGRTDAHVHAINQYAHFDLEMNIGCEGLKKALNSLLPNDIYVREVLEVASDFHARFSVKSKEYVYKINVGEYNPIERNYIYQYNRELNISKMIEAIKFFKGRHNFKSFTKVNAEKDDYEREIYDVNISVFNNIITIYFKGNGFLRYMVRNMVGALIEVGSGKKNPMQIKDILEYQDRTKAGIIAPACGLYLKNVYYE